MTSSPSNRQSTYLLPSAGGFEVFAHNTGGMSDSRTDESPTPPPTDTGKDTMSEMGGSSSLSEYYSPMSTAAVAAPCLPPESETLLRTACEEDGPISEEERLATVPVQSLLDRMNNASSRMIDCEQECRELEANRQSVVSDWSDKKKTLLKEIGSHPIDKARPLFDVYEQQLKLQQSVNEAALLYNQSVIECDEMKSALHLAGENGSTEAQLGQLLAMLVSAQTKRDTYEHLSLDRTNEFKHAQQQVAELRKTVGLRTVERAWPWFEAFLHFKGLSEELTDKIHTLKKEMSTLREEYRDCMQELEAISAKVHAIRKRHEQSLG